MYSMPQAFMDAFASSYRDSIRVKVTIGSTEYTSDAGDVCDMELNETLGDEASLPIGQCGSAELTLVLAGVDPAGLSEATVRPYVTIGASTSWCPMGVFRVDSISSPDNYETIKLVCYDAMYYADKVTYESSLVFPTTLENVLTEVNRQTGIQLEPGTTIPGYTVDKEPSGYTCRQMYGFIAGVLGANARISRSLGRLQFYSYLASSAVSITGDSQFDDGGQLNHNTELQVAGLNIKCGNDTWQYSGGESTALAEYDASAAQDRSVLLKVYENGDGSYYMEVSGEGPMKDWASRSVVPWKDYISGTVSAAFEDGVTSIGAYALDNSGSPFVGLASVQMADSVESIGANAFYYQRQLTYIRIGSGVKSIGAHAFSSGGLSSIYLPQGLQSIGNNAFYACSTLGKLNPVAIPDTVESIGNYAFQLCSNLSRIQFGSGLKSIGNSAFVSCSKLTRIDLSAASELQSIGNSAFYGLGIKSVAMAGPVAIGSSAFSDCSALASVNLGSACKSIGNSAFANCSKLATLAIPSTVESVGSSFIAGTLVDVIVLPADCDVYAGCLDNAMHLERIAVQGSGANESYDGVLYRNNELCIVPSAWEKTALVVPVGITEIGNYALDNITTVTSVSLPFSIKTIGTYAFGDSGITSITIDKADGSIKGAPWGATGATVTWTGGDTDA